MSTLMLRASRQLAGAFFIATFPLLGAMAGKIDFRAGIGYEFVSQEFFLDTALTVDSLDVTTALKTTYLDDYKGGIGFIYRPFEDRRLELEPSLEQTPDYLRFRFSGRSNLHPGSNRLFLSWDMERRDRYHDAEAPGDSYLTGNTQFRLIRPLSRSVNLSTRVEAGMVSFDSTDEFSLNQFRGGGRLGLQLRLPGFSSLDFSGFVYGRTVPDSNLLNYMSFGADIGFFGLLGSNDLDLRAQLERRDYNNFDDQDDYVRFEVDGRFNWHLGGKLLIRQNVEGEAVIFDAAQVLNFNYTRLAGDMLFGFEHQGLTLLAGPHVEWLNENTGDFIQAEDYVEWGAKTDVDFLGSGGIFVSVESTVGRRNLGDTAELVVDSVATGVSQSSFYFERLMLLGDVRLLGGLHFNALISAEWEWHDRADENNQIMLLSVGLSQEF